MVLALSAIRHADEQFASPVTTPLVAALCTIGRGRECDIVLEDPTRHISRKHATVFRQGDRYVLTVESRINPVLVNGQPVMAGQQAELGAGDSIIIGEYEFSVLPVAAAGTAPSAAVDPLFAAAPPASGAVDLDELFGTPSARAAPAAAPGRDLDALLGGRADASPDPLLGILGRESGRAPSLPSSDAHADPLANILGQGTESAHAPGGGADEAMFRGGGDGSIDHLFGAAGLDSGSDPLGLSGAVRTPRTDGLFGGGTGGSLELDHVHDVHLPLPMAASAPPPRELAVPKRPAPAPQITAPPAVEADPLAALFGGAAAAPADDPLGIFSAAPVTPAASPPEPLVGVETTPSPYRSAMQLRQESGLDAAAAAAPAHSSAIGGAAAGGAVRAFLEGAGMPGVVIPDAEAEAFLHECGATVRAAVEGLMAMLLARAKVKEELRASDRTMVAAQENNALKLIEHVDEALKFVFDPSTRTTAFLPPPKAVADACSDLQMHELALVAGMRAALIGAVKRFEPSIIEKRLEKEGSKSLLANKKALLWDCFVGYYQQTEKDADDNFDRVFGSAFLRAYQEQIRRLKR